jgi:hypothetical protein
MKLLNRDLGALKSKNFLPSKSTMMKSATHPVSINRSVFELFAKDFVAAIEAEP